MDAAAHGVRADAGRRDVDVAVDVGGAPPELRPPAHDAGAAAAAGRGGQPFRRPRKSLARATGDEP